MQPIFKEFKFATQFISPFSFYQCPSSFHKSVHHLDIFRMTMLIIFLNQQFSRPSGLTVKHGSISVCSDSLLDAPKVSS